jgi:hypothetical protein
MPRLSGAVAPPALQPRGAPAVSGAAAAGAPPLSAPVAASTTAAAPAPPPAAAPAAAAARSPAAASAAPRAPAPAQAQAQAQRAAPSRPRPVAVPEEVPPPPDHPFLREPRLYRQPDGSLGANKPPPEPYTVVRVCARARAFFLRRCSAMHFWREVVSASRCADAANSGALLLLLACLLLRRAQAARRAWADLVHHARVSGGDDGCAAGLSFRYGVGVSYDAHCRYLRSLGLEPERAPDGQWYGYDPAKEDPLADDAHPFSLAAAAALE